MRDGSESEYPPNNRSPFVAARQIAIVLCSGLTILFCYAGQQSLADIPLLDPDRGVLTMAPLLVRTTPAVVSVTAVTRSKQPVNPLLKDPNVRRFFGLPDEIPKEHAVGTASGVILDASKGYVVTNHHVVDKAEKIGVTIKDGRRLDAELIGSDPGTDLALLRIDNTDLTQLALGDSDTVQVGDVVFAIGNPFGLGQTVTSGIISALGRGGLSEEGYEDFIQTDASINPGNSGGALINSKGELIGVNSAILSATGGNIGIGFAVPVNMVKAVVAQLLRHGEVRRGRIGVVVTTVTPDVAAKMQLPVTRGALVVSVEKASEADRAGLQKSDVIVAIDGKSVEDAGDVRNQIGLRERGSTIDVVLFRSGKKRVLQVRIGDM